MHPITNGVAAFKNLLVNAENEDHVRNGVLAVDFQNFIASHFIVNETNSLRASSLIKN